MVSENSADPQSVHGAHLVCVFRGSRRRELAELFRSGQSRGLALTAALGIFATQRDGDSA